MPDGRLVTEGQQGEVFILIIPRRVRFTVNWPITIIPGILQICLYFNFRMCFMGDYPSVVGMSRRSRDSLFY